LLRQQHCPLPPGEGNIRINGFDPPPIFPAFSNHSQSPSAASRKGYIYVISDSSATSRQGCPERKLPADINDVIDFFQFLWNEYSSAFMRVFTVFRIISGEMSAMGIQAGTVPFPLPSAVLYVRPHSRNII
jgi:hypothetical protein